MVLNPLKLNWQSKYWIAMVSGLIQWLHKGFKRWPIPTERIRNTLSHEMCHLATWVIDKKLDENHGKLFKYWCVTQDMRRSWTILILHTRASKVTKRRPDIEISVFHVPRIHRTQYIWMALQTRHDYEISYPYKWGTLSMKLFLVYCSDFGVRMPELPKNVVS